MFIKIWPGMIINTEYIARINITDWNEAEQAAYIGYFNNASEPIAEIHFDNKKDFDNQIKLLNKSLDIGNDGIMHEIRAIGSELSCLADIIKDNG